MRSVLTALILSFLSGTSFPQVIAPGMYLLKEQKQVQGISFREDGTGMGIVMRLDMDIVLAATTYEWHIADGRLVQTHVRQSKDMENWRVADDRSTPIRNITARSFELRGPRGWKRWEQDDSCRFRRIHCREHLEEKRKLDSASRARSAAGTASVPESPPPK